MPTSFNPSTTDLRAVERPGEGGPTHLRQGRSHHAAGSNAGRGDIESEVYAFLSQEIGQPSGWDAAPVLEWWHNGTLDASPPAGAAVIDDETRTKSKEK